jgi:hypothetical protein
MHPEIQRAIVIGVILLNGYSLGANCVERFVNYQTWPHVGISSFRTYHRAQAPLIRIFIVTPLAAGFSLQILLLTFYRTLGIAPLTAWTMLIASVIGLLSTLTIQIPIHRQFDVCGYSSSLLHRLLLTDWIRKGADLARLAATVALLEQVLK